MKKSKIPCWDWEDNMNKFLATPIQRRKLVHMKAKHFSEKSRNTRRIAVRILFIVLGLGTLFVGAMALLEALEEQAVDLETIGMTVMFGVIGLMFFWLATPNKGEKETPHWVTRLEKWGGLETAISEIHSHVKGGLPVYHVWADRAHYAVSNVAAAVVGGAGGMSNAFFVAGKWWINGVDDKDTCEIVNIGEIAAIIGDTELGTNAILTDGTVVSALFGRNQWNEVFGLFSAVNPHILHMDEEIRLPNGTVSEVYYAVMQGFTEILAELRNGDENADYTPPENFRAVISEFEKRRNL